MRKLVRAARNALATVLLGIAFLFDALAAMVEDDYQ